VQTRRTIVEFLVSIKRIDLATVIRRPRRLPRRDQKSLIGNEEGNEEIASGSASGSSASGLSP
jgi:hypothetical protein